MKRKLLTLILLATFVVASGCQTKLVVFKGNGKKAPPGQVKKATGSKSAKPFAPGQQKKKKNN